MTRIFSFTPRLGVFAVLAAGLLSSTAVYAGEQTRAEAAIAEASGKIEAGDKAGVGTQAPELQKQAHEALMTAQDLLSHHKKSEALSAAQHAGELADQAMVVANRHKSEADSHRRDDQRDAEARAHESAAVADTRANSAEAATAAANTRAAVAEQASATANAQADAMRNAPPVIAPPTTTTVTMTAHDDTVATPVAPVHRKHHRIIHRHGRAAHVKSTTTTVTTTHR
jgi:hypothetical protein